MQFWIQRLGQLVKDLHKESYGIPAAAYIVASDARRVYHDV